MNTSNGGMTRRGLLRRAAGVGLTVSSVAVAGCVEALPPLGQRVRYGRVDVPTPPSAIEGPTYRDWVPAATALPEHGEFSADEDDLDPGYVNAVAPGTMGTDFDGDGAPNRLAHTFQKPHIDYFGVGYENYDRVIGLHGFGTTFVFVGDVGSEPVGSTLTESGFGPAGTYGEWDLFDRARGRRTVAVRDDAIVWSQHARSADIVRAVVDAERGSVDRHHEVDETFAVATAAAGMWPWTWIGGLGVFPDTEALEVMSVTADSSAVYNISHLVYPDAESVSERRIMDALNRNTRAREALSVDIHRDGRVATVEMHRPHSSVDDPYEGVQIPQITWGVTRDRDALTVRHEAGETVPANRLTFHFEKTDGRTPTTRQFGDVTEVVEAGDAITVPIPAGQERPTLLGAFSPSPEAHAASLFVVYRSP